MTEKIVDWDVKHPHKQTKHQFRTQCIRDQPNRKQVGFFIKNPMENVLVPTSRTPVQCYFGNIKVVKMNASNLNSEYVRL